MFNRYFNDLVICICFQESIYEVELMERAMSEIPAVPSSPTPTNVA